jgi:hypothetical protein
MMYNATMLAIFWTDVLILLQTHFGEAEACLHGATEWASNMSSEVFNITVLVIRTLFTAGAVIVW